MKTKTQTASRPSKGPGGKQVRLEPGVHKKLKMMAAKKGMTISDLIAHLISLNS